MVEQVGQIMADCDAAGVAQAYGGGQDSIGIEDQGFRHGSLLDRRRNYPGFMR